MKRYSILIAIGAVLVLASPANAQVFGGGPGGPPPGGGPVGGGGTTTSTPSSTTSQNDGGGNRFHWSTQATFTVIGTLAGDAILAAGDASPLDYTLWNIGSGIFGPVGGAGLLALFSEDGIITNTINDTWKCQPNDRRDRCRIWVQLHPQKFSRRHRHRRHHRMHRAPRMKHIPLPHARPR